MSRIRLANLRAFSLIELVIVVVIIGVIGAIAIPRLSRFSDSAPAAAYKADLNTIQNAVDRYVAEHVGKMPDAAQFALQMTQYTDVHGNVSATKTATHVYGPYLRKLPELKASPKLGDPGVTADDLATGGADEIVVKSVANKDVGWRMDVKTGQVRVKTGGVQALNGGAVQAEAADGP